MNQHGNDRSNPARIVYTISKSDGTNAWSLVETIGSSLSRPLVEIWVPADKAAEVVAIITRAHGTITKDLLKCAGEDSEWREYNRRMGFPVEDLLRRPGRPAMSPQDLRMMQIVNFLHDGHTVTETATHFDVKPSTVERYEKEVKKRRSFVNDENPM